jgi:hypothetical protein
LDFYNRVFNDWFFRGYILLQGDYSEVI